MWVVVKIRVPFWGTLNARCRIIIGTQRGTNNFDNHPCMRVLGLLASAHRVGLKAGTAISSVRASSRTETVMIMLPWASK